MDIEGTRRPMVQGVISWAWGVISWACEQGDLKVGSFDTCRGIQ